MTLDYHFVRNQRNRYLQDREEQRTSTFTGMGSVFVAQDALANVTSLPCATYLHRRVLGRHP